MTPEDLGYRYSAWGYYEKEINHGDFTAIVYEKSPSYKWKGEIYVKINIPYQKEIDNLQIAYNNLQRDLKELNK